MRRTELEPTCIYFEDIWHEWQVAICYTHKLPQNQRFRTVATHKIKGTTKNILFVVIKIKLPHNKCYYKNRIYYIHELLYI